ncbi:hypothetical protein [Actinomadura chibensis]|uniref:hypothetical protein n=1 Tax=Actinomadura chibensis TaxID=392828 RepID=UPI001C3F1EA8
MSAKTIAGAAAARERAPRATLVRQAHGGEGRLDRVRGPQVEAVLGGEVEERRQFGFIIGDLLHRFGELAP